MKVPSKAVISSCSKPSTQRHFDGGRRFQLAQSVAQEYALQQSLGASIPFPKRLGKAGEFAQLVRHMIENLSLNGEVVRLDGALRLPPR